VRLYVLVFVKVESFQVYLALDIYTEKILVVDDELSIRQILETRLSIRGYNVILASNGEEALYLFRKESPNIVILDLMLPKIDGYEVCVKIRKRISSSNNNVNRFG